MNIKNSNQILDTKILTKLLETFIYIVNSTIMRMHMHVHTHLNHNWTKAILNNKSEYHPLIESPKKKKTHKSKH